MTNVITSVARRCLPAVLLSATWLVGACAPSGPSPAEILQTKLNDCQGENATLQNEIQELKRHISDEAAQHAAQIETLQGLGPGRLAKLFVVDRIELGRHTGGYQQDDQPFDSGVRVHLQPIDQQGSVLKAAGDVTVEIYDLAEPPAANLLSTHRFPVDEIGQHWASGFLTYQYSFNCPWQTAPKHSELTVKVVFTDFLTGKSFEITKTFRVKIPPATQPTQPATQASR